MAGYLDQYGAGEEHREKIIKIVALSVAGVLIAGGILYFIFKNYAEERQVKRFFELLNAHDYSTAYGLWGCTASNPCRDYPMPKFMEDWGPQSTHAAGPWNISKTRSCGSGVIVTIRHDSQEDKLWVERNNLNIGFSPFPGCPPGR